LAEDTINIFAINILKSIITCGHFSSLTVRSTDGDVCEVCHPVKYLCC
jgi:hypothetical protein